MAWVFVSLVTSIHIEYVIAKKVGAHMPV